MSKYKSTLNLPKTEFPMKAGLTAREPERLKQWEGLYQAIQERRKDAPIYVMHDGPPFANGDVHMGTALNKILKDFVVKSRTMMGYRVPFVPGWDCHGLPIEFKVVQEQRGLEPAEVRRRSEKYARKYIDIQRSQFRRLGVLGDWENPYLTLSPGYEATIVRSFARFVEAGLVYQSRKPVLWSTGAQTALAEAEVEYQDKTSTAVSVKFRVPEGRFAGTSIVIWTTTPWTLPANLAIAVHPHHTYVRARLAEHGEVIVAEELLSALASAAGASEPEIVEKFAGSELAGVKALHPFLGRESTVYTADFVTLDTGTGCVHIAPGHGEDDYRLGREHDLALLSPVDDRGCFTEECGLPELVGQYVFAANEKIVEILKQKEVLVTREDYQHSYPHCWRSKTPVIFRAIEQFFIRIDEIRESALSEVEKVSWLPHWGRNRIAGTVASRPDWCISRQRTWGVPLPAFYTADGTPILDPEVIRKVADTFEQEGTNAWYEKSDEEWAQIVQLPAGSSRRSDTLDVWIDSGLSHEAVLRTRLSFPADLYLEATDQHRGWFQSSLMTSVALNGCAPYRKVLTHGFVVDVDTRKKISKSAQGGYKKPTDAAHFVNKYGADLVRLWVSSVNFTDDVPFSEEIFKRLADSYRRIRNTLRILLANAQEADGDFEPTFVDRWIMARFQQVIGNVRTAYENLEFHHAYREINEFCAVDLSSLYVDITKDRLYCDKADSTRRRATAATMHQLFSGLCRLLAPILAFTADEAWGYFSPAESVHLQDLPEVDPKFVDPDCLELMESAMKARAKTMQAIESAQKQGDFSGPLEASVSMTLPTGRLAEFAAQSPEQLEELFILSDLKVSSGDELDVLIRKTPYGKCERCWRHRPEVGSIADHPTLCSRCYEAVK